MLEPESAMTDKIESLLSPQERAFAGAVLYASLFQFPLTGYEVKQSFLESSLQSATVSQIYSRSRYLPRIVEFQQGFYFPTGMSSWIQLREERSRRSVQLLREHRLVLKLICALPFTRMVALSGSISHLNVVDDGDVDLLIITKGERVWSTTVAVILLAKMMRCRDSICLNFVLSDQRLEIQKRDLFDANQMIHLRPLLGADVYREFLERNRFVWDFYPDFCPEDDKEQKYRPGYTLLLLKRCLEAVLGLGIWRVAESFCRSRYRRHLISKSMEWTSSEEVELAPDRLKLHTCSHRLRILNEFRECFDTAMNELGRKEMRC